MLPSSKPSTAQAEFAWPGLSQQKSKPGSPHSQALTMTLTHKPKEVVISDVMAESTITS
jgi:hypothetical protein